MKKIIKLFTDHPNSLGESYLQHFKVAFTLGVKGFVFGAVQVFHAFFPFFVPSFPFDVNSMMIYLETILPQNRKGSDE